MKSEEYQKIVDELVKALLHYMQDYQIPPNSMMLNPYTPKEQRLKDDMERDHNCGCCSGGSTGAVAFEVLNRLGLLK